MNDLLQTFSKKPLLGIAFIIGIIALLGGIIYLVFGYSPNSSIEQSEGDITIKKGSESISISKDGRVSLNREGQNYTDFWDSEKLELFKLYLSENASGSFTFTGFSIIIDGDTYSLPGDDELINLIISETQTGGTSSDGGSGGSNDDGGLDEYFTSPTPAPSSATSGGSSGGSTGGGPSWCKLWRLSYCADPLPAPSPSITPTPLASEVPYVFDCSLGGDMVTDRTVISNTLCIKEPSPTP